MGFRYIGAKTRHAVWSNFADCLHNSDLLRQSVRNAVRRLEERKKQYGDTHELDLQLTKVRDQIERTGEAYADGALGKELYTDKLGKLKKRQSQLKERISNLNPEHQAEIQHLERCISTVNQMLENDLAITKKGIRGYTYDKTTDTFKVIPLGWNLSEIDTLLKNMEFEKHNKLILPKAHDSLPEPDPQEWRMTIRALLQVFDVRIMVYPDRVEVHGILPEQVIGIPEWGTKSKGAPISQSVCGM